MKLIKNIFLLILIYSSIFSQGLSETINKIDITGNSRVSDETILMFASVDPGLESSIYDLNDIIKNIYSSNFFENISISISDNTLHIFVKEYPVIGNISFEGIKSKKILKEIKKKLVLKNRSSLNDFLLINDKEKISEVLKNLGYYFPKIEIYQERQSNNIVNLNFKIETGEKSKISKISFIGNKIFKDKKLKNIIISEESKPWKFISSKKYLNENLINYDNRLLKNFYLNQGFYNVKILSSFAKYLNDSSFELIFNIDAGHKFFFNNLTLNVPSDFDPNNFDEIYELFDNYKGEKYSFVKIEKILNKIDNLVSTKQFQSTKATVIEKIIDNKIDLDFKIEESDKIFVEKINILGNNVTRENVIRNQLVLDEGDPFNEILTAKSVNNLKSLNFFSNVESEILQGSDTNQRIINLTVKEKATGEITAGAGVGTSGGTFSAGVKENNYLGKGIQLNSNLTLREDSIKGLFSVVNPNYQNSDKSVNFSVEASELNKLTDFGYKTNKTGFSLGTDFEYYEDLILGFGLESYFEKIETDSTASERQKAQQGNYFDNFLNIKFDYDKRNQKFQTTEGFRNYYSVNMPIISETNSLTNTFFFNNYNQIFEKNIIKTSFFFQSANSLTDDEVKLSERLTIPSSKLRGFEYGKVGPKDGDDYIGGNFISSFNISATLPQILENIQSTDFLVFFDAANIWGVDYDSSIDKSNNIRSSVGLGLDWFSAIGPLNFSIALPLTKSSSDKTESFRFNLGTTF